MVKLKIKLLLSFLIAAAACVYYYVTIPAVGIHSSGFWLFIISLVVVRTRLLSARSMRDGYAVWDIRPFKIGGLAAVVLCLI